MRRIVLVASLLVLAAGSARAQDEDEGVGIGPAPTEARALVARAVEAMGGRERVSALKAAVMTVEAAQGEVQERHTLRLEGRFLHYSSRRPSGAGFDVVLARGLAFLCDRDDQGAATYLEDLGVEDAVEGGYERDILFMPLLLPLLLEQRARMDYRGRTSEGDEVVRALIEPPEGAPGRPFVIRLRFDKETHLLTAAMGVVPLGYDKGKKRYCEYRDYREVAGPGGALKLPAELSDQRGKENEEPRTFKVRWSLDPDLPATLWLKPKLAEDGAEAGK